MPGYETSAATPVCAACNRPLPANAPSGLCPACLMRQGVELIALTSAKSGEFVPPGAEELALLFPEFEILGCLGRGGMGVVYKARQIDLDRTVAVKILPPELMADPEFTERFRREAATLAHLDHPNIVRIFDYGQREEFAYFVMEFVDGTDLSRRITTGPLPTKEAYNIVAQLCDALQHSHERGVVHRDIKPANILISRDGRVKVADFGLARLARPDGGDLSLTRTRATLGTPCYMAPEQMSGTSDTDHRVDIYALGVVLYEMLTGHLPVGHFDPPSGKVSSLNPRIDEVVLRALNTEPGRRFSAATEVKAGLREAIENPAPTHSERRRALAWRAFAISVLAALVGTGAVLFWATHTGKKALNASNSEKPAIGSPGRTAGRLVSFGGMARVLPSDSGPIVDVAMSAAREEFGLALRTDGTVMAWGNTRFGQTNVPTGLRGVVAIAVGQGARSAHALALRSDGRVVGWGDNTFHQARPPSGLGQVIAIAAGELHSLALTAGGRLVAWGYPNGQGATVPRNLMPAQAVAAGANFNVVLLTNGLLAAWGENDAGQCDVPRPTVPAVEVAAGTKHALARFQNGRVVAWGENGSGQCNVPVTLPTVARIFAGGETSAAVDQSGNLHVWGRVPAGMNTFTGKVTTVAFGTTAAVVLEPAP